MKISIKERRNMKKTRKLITIIIALLALTVSIAFTAIWITSTPLEQAHEETTERFGTIIFIENIGSGMNRVVTFVVDEDWGNEFVVSHPSIWRENPMDVLHLGQTVYFRVFYNPIDETQTRVSTNIVSLRTEAGGYIFTLADYNQHMQRLNTLFNLEAAGMILISLAVFVHSVFVLRGKNIFDKIACKLAGGNKKIISCMLGIIALALVGLAVTAFILVGQSENFVPSHRTFAVLIALPAVFIAGILSSLRSAELVHKKPATSKKKTVTIVVVALLIVAIAVGAFFLLRNTDEGDDYVPWENDNQTSEPPPYVTLGGQQIQSNVTELELDLTAVDDVTQLAYLQGLHSLTISNFAGDIEDPNALMQAIGDLTNLRELCMTLIPIYGHAPLANLQYLERLSIAYSFLPNISHLSALTNLEELILLEVGVSDISPLASLTGLRTLTLDRNEIVDISPLENLVALERLDLSFNAELSDISAITGMKNLQHLTLRDTSVEDLSPLSELASLEILDLENANVSDITPITGTTALLQLFLGNNVIADISPLASLENLSELWLQNNRVADVTPLAEMFSLRMLELGGNPVTDLSPLVHLYETVVNPMGEE